MAVVDAELAAVLPAFEGALFEVDLAFGKREVGVRTRVADGVEVVIDAYQRDAVRADVEAPRRGGCESRRRRTTRTASRRLLAQLGGDRCGDERARGLDRQSVEHLVEEAGDDEAFGP